MLASGEVGVKARCGTYETCPVRPEPANELLPRRTRVGEHDDAPDEIPSDLYLLLAHAPGLVCAKTHAVDVLERLARVHLDELADVAPDEGR